MYFTGKDDGPSIEEYIKSQKSLWKENWKFCLHMVSKKMLAIWWKSFGLCEDDGTFNEAYEK
jgi:hypothetical protein